MIRYREGVCDIQQTCISSLQLIIRYNVTLTVSFLVTFAFEYREVALIIISRQAVTRPCDHNVAKGRLHAAERLGSDSLVILLRNLDLTSQLYQQ